MYNSNYRYLRIYDKREYTEMYENVHKRILYRMISQNRVYIIALRK